MTGKSETLISPSGKSNEAEVVFAGDTAITAGQNIRRLQILDLGDRFVGVFADEIATIVEWRNPTPLPFAPPTILGVVSIQGRMLTLLDLASLCGEGDNRIDRSCSFIVALRGDEQIALAVKNLGDAIAVATTEFKPVTGEPTMMVATVAHGGGTVGLLDLTRVFAAAMKGRERRRRHFVEE